MCNRVVQKDKVVKPGENVMVLLRGPGAEFELPFAGAVFAGPARKESRNYWIQREGAEELQVRGIVVHLSSWLVDWPLGGAGLHSGALCPRAHARGP